MRLSLGEKGGQMSGMSDWVLALAVIACILLGGGGIRLVRRRQSRTQGVLMIVAALVILMNVMIWTL
ncbi:MAG: hypothetical protein ABIS39_07195 [Sphingomicrobium sp.]